MDVDRALETLGDWSRWKLSLYFSSSIFCGFIGGWNMLAIVFLGMMPDYHCQLPDGFHPNTSIPQISKGGLVIQSSCPIDNSTLGNTTLPPPVTDEDFIPESCRVWDNYDKSSGNTTACPNGYHFPDENLHSIVHEWLLVCDRSYLVETSQTVLVVGVMLGAMIMSGLSDRFGRKIVFLSSIYALGIIGFITAWVTNPIAFMVMRFGTGFFQQGVVLGGFVYICELFPASQRTVMGQLMQLAWAFGMAILALLAWLIPNWRYFLLSISLPSFLAIPCIWLFPESVPWLVAKERILEAKVILHKAAILSKKNPRLFPQDLQLTEQDRAELKQAKLFKKQGIVARIKDSFTNCFKSDGKKEESTSEAANYTIVDVVKSCRLLTFALIMCYLWCVNGLVYYGLSLSTGSLAGDPYINFMLSGLVEVPAYIIAAFALKYIGRRWSIFAFHLIAGVPLFVTLFIPQVLCNGTNLQPLIVTLAMIGKFGITGSFGSIFLYAPELFPTTVRSIGIGIASVGGRLGNIVAPFSSLVAREVWWLPNVIFGVMALVGAVLTLLLPETLNRPLPQTIQDVESWSRTISKADKRRFKEEQRAMKEMKDMQNGNYAEQETLQPLNEKDDQ